MKVNCANCNKNFDKTKTEILKTGNNFCSRSCSATFNNKKSISEFNLNTLVSEVNSENNLILLCPNCHWEFDNNMIIID